MPMRNFGKGMRQTRLKEIYCCIPESMKRKEADPFDYKLRSLAEVKEQMRIFPPDFFMNVETKVYFAGDVRKNNPNNTDDRGRVSRIHFDLRDLNLAPLQRDRFIFLLGPRFNPEKPHTMKIVTKQYPTYLENYFKGMETIKELYWEALRAPDTPVNF